MGPDTPLATLLEQAALGSPRDAVDAAAPACTAAEPAASATEGGLPSAVTGGSAGTAAAAPSGEDCRPSAPHTEPPSGKAPLATLLKQATLGAPGDVVDAAAPTCMAAEPAASPTEEGLPGAVAGGSAGTAAAAPSGEDCRPGMPHTKPPSGKAPLAEREPIVEAST